MYLNSHRLDKKLENKELLFELFEGFSVLDDGEKSTLYTLSRDSKVQNTNKVHVIFLGIEFDKYGAEIGLNFSDSLNEVNKIIKLNDNLYKIQPVTGGYKGQLEQSLMITFNRYVSAIKLVTIIERLRNAFRQESILYIDPDSEAHFITE